MMYPISYPYEPKQNCFKQGDIVILGRARWFEHNSSTEKGALSVGDQVVVLSDPFMLGTRTSWVAFVLYNTTIGYIKLLGWVDEVVS